MPGIKPVRVIDITKSLKVSTSTVIDSLKRNGYPVEKSHHTPLIPEILAPIFKDINLSTESEIFIDLQENCIDWAGENPEATDQIRNIFQKKSHKIRLKTERERKITENREKRLRRQELEKEEIEKASESAKTDKQTLTPVDGHIPTDYLFLEIVRLTLLLPVDQKRKILLMMREMN